MTDASRYDGRARCPAYADQRRMDSVNVPHAMRPYADQTATVTNAVCREHLDPEYADLCRTVIGKLARKRPSPLVRGDLGIWAAGVLYVVAQQNFLFDPAQTPHANARPAQRVDRGEEDDDVEQSRVDPQRPEAEPLRYRRDAPRAGRVESAGVTGRGRRDVGRRPTSSGMAPSHGLRAGSDPPSTGVRRWPTVTRWIVSSS